MSTAPAQPDANKCPLPEGWRWVRLGEVIIEAQPGFACGERDPNGVVQLRMNNVDIRGNCVLEEYIRVPADVLTIQRYALKPGDILFNNTNSVELVGKTALFRGYSEPVVYSNHLTVLRTNPELLDPEYLAKWLLLQWKNKLFEHICNRWIGQSAVKNNKLLSFEIPLPPLPEQKRIAAILKERMAAVERARRAVEEQLEAAKALPAAYLREVFPRQGASLPEGWRWVKLGEVCERIEYGYTASADLDIVEPHFLRITDIQNGHVVWDKVPGCKISPEEEEKYLLFDGDIVFARTGATTGKSYLIRRPPRSVFASYLIRLRPKTHICADFMYEFFQSSTYWQQIYTNIRGAGQPNVNASLLSKMVIPLPPLSEQKRIAAILKERMAAVERLRKALEEQLEAINKLPAAILRKAFSGEL